MQTRWSCARSQVDDEARESVDILCDMFASMSIVYQPVIVRLEANQAKRGNCATMSLQWWQSARRRVIHYAPLSAPSVIPGLRPQLCLRPSVQHSIFLWTLTVWLPTTGHWRGQSVRSWSHELCLTFSFGFLTSVGQRLLLLLVSSNWSFYKFQIVA